MRPRFRALVESALARVAGALAHPPRDPSLRMTAFVRFGLVIAGFVILTLAMTFPLVATLGSTLPSDLGDPLLNAWILAWDADRLLHGLQGLWQAPFYYPYANTLAYSEHLLGVAVFVAPLQWVFGNLVLTYNVAFMASYVLAGCGMYVLVRYLTDSGWAAVVAGVAFAFCPYRTAQLSHLQVLMSGWMPLGLWALHRYGADGRRSALCLFVGAFLLQGLSNGYYLFFFAVPVCVVGLDALVRAGARRTQMLVEFVVGASVIAAVLLPIISVYVDVRSGLGLVRNAAEIQANSADVVSYFHIAPSLWLWAGVLPVGKQELELFAGVTVMLLASVAALTAWRRDRGRTCLLRSATLVYGLIAIVAVGLSLGPRPHLAGAPLLDAGPYQWLLSVVPGFDGLRVPSRLAIVVFLATSVLAGIGVARVFAWLPPSPRAAVGLLLLAAILAEGYGGPLPVHALERQSHADDRPVYQWLAAQPPGGVLELPIQSDSPTAALRFLYRTLEHRHPIVNGYSGYTTPLAYFLRDAASPAGDPAQMGDLMLGLRAMGVRYLVIHRSLYEDVELASETLLAVREQSGQVESIREWGSCAIVHLRTASPPSHQTSALRLVPAAQFSVHASHLEERLPMAFDHDVGTRWLTGERQAGREWIEVTFGRPRDVARIRFQIDPRSLFDYPRRLRVESSSDGAPSETVLHEGAFLPSLLVALTRSDWPSTVDIDLEGNASRAIRVRQVGQTRALYWSVDELSIWERTDPGPR